MQLKEHLIEAFKFNEVANKKLLVKIRLLGNKEESVKLFSHLINTQDKWMEAILEKTDFKKLDWWKPVYQFEQLDEKWNRGINRWIDYIKEKTDDELTEDIIIVYGNETWAVTLKDIALQLNYHSIHHRAQIQTMIRQQGIEPDFLDYIGTKFRKTSG